MPKKRFNNILYKEVSNAPLVIYRIAFGALMLFSTLRFIAKGWIETKFVAPKFFFTYYGFDWIKPLSENGMYLVFILMAIAALFILVGFKYRFASIAFFVLFTYTELIDKTHYLNHYYFVSLIAFLMCWLPANRRFSVDALLNPKIKTNKTTAWHINIIKFQMAVVYFFAGLAKINADWLINAQPLKLWLHSKHDLNAFLKEEWVAYFASWFGLFYDLLIPFALLWRKTRPLAYFFVVAFHLATWILFPIGVFPWVMMVGALIFFSPTFHEKLLAMFGDKTENSSIYGNTPHSNLSKYLILTYVGIQLFLPMRYLLYPGNLFWNEEGYRFSWRVMLMEKHGYARFFIKNKDTGKEIEINNKDYLTPRQEKQMSSQPDFILQYAHHLKSIYQDSTFVFGQESQTWNNIGVHAKVMVTLNSRPSQLFVSKEHDLTEKKYNLCHRDWIEPFKE